MILTLIEHEEEVINKASLEALTFARGLAAEADVPLTALLCGGDVYEFEDILTEYGVATVYHSDDDRLDEFAPDAWAACIAHMIDAEDVSAVVTGGTERANEVLGRAAARLNLPMCANVLSVGMGDDEWTVQRVRWGGSLLEDATLDGDVKLMSVALHSLEGVPEEGEDDVEIEDIDVEFSDNDFLVKVVGRVTPEKEGVSLADAPVVVSGGRGVGSEEAFAPLYELAGLLDGAVGCSRAVTNHGWQPHANQVGQTGVRVAPTIYFACGISGASQHMAGCAGSKYILTINKDPEAPILARSHYAVIGDLHEVVPAISAEIKARR